MQDPNEESKQPIIEGEVVETIETITPEASEAKIESNESTEGDKTEEVPSI